MSYSSVTYSGVHLPFYNIYSMGLSYGDQAIDTVINHGGTQVVSYGGYASRTSIRGGSQYINGGSADDTTIDNWGVQYIYHGSARNTSVSWGTQFIAWYGSAGNTTVNNGGTQTISAGGTATQTTLNGGEQYVGGTAESTTINGGEQYVEGGFAGNTSIHSGKQFISGGGSVRSTTVDYSGEQYIINGSAERTTVNHGGTQTISARGTATQTTLNGGTQHITGGTAENTNINGGEQHVEGGTAGNTSIFNGKQFVSARGSASGTFIANQGTQYIADGFAVNTSVGFGGAMHVSPAGTVSGLTIDNGGYFSVHAGAILAGIITVGGYMTLVGAVNADNAEINMAVNRRTVDDGAIINNLKYISSNASYSITVNPAAYGTYTLASGVQDFTASITVKNQKGKVLGTLSPETTLAVNKTIYTLQESAGELFVTLTEDPTGTDPEPEPGPGPDPDPGPGPKPDPGPGPVPEPEIPKTISGTISRETPAFSIAGQVLPDAFITISGDFGTLNASIEIRDENGKTTASGTIHGGRLSFKPALLNLGYYTITVHSSDGGVTNGNFTLTLDAANFVTVKDDWGNVRTAGAAGLPEAYSLGTISAPGELLNEYVGYADAVDYRKFTLDSSAKLTFSIFADGKTELTVYRLSEKNGTYSLKKIKSVSGKANQTAVLKELLLEKGDYYFSVKSPDAKQGGEALYTVGVQENSLFYTKGDNKDDWTDLKTTGAAGLDSAYKLEVKGGVTVSDWVGFGDAIDYRKLELDSPAKLSLTVASGDNAVLTLHELVANKNGSYKLKRIKSVSVKAGSTAVLENLLLDDSKDYYISVKSSNAGKGGNADYTVQVNHASVFYTEGNNADDWTDVKTAGAAGLPEAFNLGSAAEGTRFTEWVGFGDAVDYRKFEVDAAAYYDLDFRADDKSKLAVFKLTQKSGNYALKQLKSVTHSGDNLSRMIEGLRLEAGTYYLGISSTNAMKGGNADYSVEFNRITLA